MLHKCCIFFRRFIHSLPNVALKCQRENALTCSTKIVIFHYIYMNNAAVIMDISFSIQRMRINALRATHI